MIRSWRTDGKGDYRRQEPRLLKPILQNGYYKVGLYNLGKIKQIRLHRLVLMAHVGLPKAGQVGRHLNGDSLDNRLENLAWGTSKENSEDRIRHGRSTPPNKKMTPELLAEILCSEESSSVIGKRLGLHHSTIRKWRSGAYTFNKPSHL